MIFHRVGLGLGVGQDLAAVVDDGDARSGSGSGLAGELR